VIGDSSGVKVVRAEHGPFNHILSKDQSSDASALRQAHTHAITSPKAVLDFADFAATTPLSCRQLPHNSSTGVEN